MFDMTQNSILAERLEGYGISMVLLRLNFSSLHATKTMFREVLSLPLNLWLLRCFCLPCSAFQF